MKAWHAILEAAASDRAALRAACRDPRLQQERYLRRIVQTERSTQFGLTHDFARIRTIDDFRAAVPIRPYEAFAPWIERSANGERCVLTQDDIVAFEETGGSSSGAKLIPYTANSFAAFRAAVLPWLAALAERRPGICVGPAYAAVSPRMRPPRSLPCGLSVGLPSEAAYLGNELHGPLSELLVMPSGALDAQRWRTSTLAALVAQRDLAFIAIYSPTFLLELIDDSSVDTERLWPRLDAIATWTEGASSGYARHLAERFPHAHIDARGVLATESALTVRIDEQEGCVPALTSAFVELIDRSDRAHLSHEATPGEIYRMVITTPGGLYRYDIQDEFECVGFCDDAPRLKFLGRAGVASDLVGEKLTDAFVSQALAPLSLPAALAPVSESKPHYELWVDAMSSSDDEQLAQRADDLLKMNPQYDYARAAGQLGPIRVIAKRGYTRYRQDTLTRRGMRAGDVKATSLILDRSTLPLRDERNAV